MRFDYKKRVILYLDILGYKHRFKEDDFDPLQYLDIVQETMAISCQTLKIDGAENKIGIKIFSDNICVTFDYPKDTGFLLAKVTASEIQQCLLEELGVLIRGSIVYDEIYMDDTMVYGAGIIKCDELEKEAKMPRIIIDKALYDVIDNDGYDVVRENKQCYEIVYLRETDDSNMIKTGQQIIKLVDKYCAKDNKALKNMKEEQRKGIIEKHLWLIDTFNLYNFIFPIFYRSDRTSYIEIIK